MADKSDGSQIPIYASSLPEARKLADVENIASDIWHVIGCLKRLHAGEADLVLQKALTISALVTYRRCFKQADRDVLSTADAETRPSNSKGTHNTVLLQADKLAADSVNGIDETIPGIMVKDGRVVGVTTLSAGIMNFSGTQIYEWGHLAGDIYRNVLKPRIIEYRQAFVEAAQKQSLGEITKQPPAAFKIPSAAEAELEIPRSA